MVHALEETWRVLTPGGTLVDIRPYSNNPVVEIHAGQAVYQAGQIDDSPGLPADLAADHAVQTMVDRRAFVQLHETRFPLVYSWSSLDDMRTYITERWEDWANLPDEVLEKAGARIAASREPIRVRVLREMHLARTAQDENAAYDTERGNSRNAGNQV